MWSQDLVSMQVQLFDWNKPANVIARGIVSITFFVSSTIDTRENNEKQWG